MVEDDSTALRYRFQLYNSDKVAKGIKHSFIRSAFHMDALCKGRIDSLYCPPLTKILDSDCPVEQNLALKTGNDL